MRIANCELEGQSTLSGHSLFSLSAFQFAIRTSQSATVEMESFSIAIRNSQFAISLLGSEVVGRESQWPEAPCHPFNSQFAIRNSQCL